MAFTPNQSNQVNTIIEKYCKDIIVRVQCKNIAGTEMNNDKTPQEVADSVYDYIIKNFSGDSVSCTMNKALIQYQDARNMRDEIISAIS